MSQFVSPVMRLSNRKTGGSVLPTNNASSPQPSPTTQLVQGERGKSIRENRPHNGGRYVPSYKITHKIIVVNRTSRYKTRDLHYIDTGRAKCCWPCATPCKGCAGDVATCQHYNHPFQPVLPFDLSQPLLPPRFQSAQE